MSPDTDVYNIGLSLASVENKQVAIQVNTYNSKEMKFVILNNLVKALSNDPDLARINPDLLPQVLQIIYICTGCDYLSFFSQIGKATFLRYFFQYASFITGGNETHPGTLADIGLEDGSYKRGYRIHTFGGNNILQKVCVWLRNQFLPYIFYYLYRTRYMQHT